ncbi:MAG: ATP-binding protein [Flavobacteriaceae bacterium]|nr:ATP-binding protein [Flavobacteriaceae bacterium]
MKPIAPNNFFNYFKECYKIDNKEFVVDNILTVKYKYKWFARKKEELLNNQLPIIPYDNKNIENLIKDLTLYNLEKELYYGSFFILGKTTPNGLKRDSTICSPLVLFLAEIKKIDEDYFLSIDESNFLLNQSLLSKLSYHSDKDKKSLFEALTNIFNNPVLDAFEIRRLLDKHVLNLHTEELSFYPSLWSDSKIKKQLKEITEIDTYKIVPSAGTIFLTKSLSSLKVVTDLEEIAKQNTFNNALDELIHQTVDEFETKSSYLEHRLNKDQTDALVTTQKFTNSVIIGPPGTGKSYTISAIAIDAILNNKSVLIVSKTKQAVEVIRQMLLDDFKIKEYLIHTSGKRYKTSLKALVKRKLSNITKRQKAYSYNIKSLDNELKHAEKEFHKIVEQELQLSALNFNEDPTLKEKVHRLFLNNFNSLDDSIWDEIAKINNRNTSIQTELKKHVLATLSKLNKNNTYEYRRELSAYYEALICTNFTESQEIIDTIEFDKILKIFPLWLANLSELNTVLPLQKELFDLVIIDEATQCDIATALPAIYRAKKVLVAGDPNQLKHYSFVSRSAQQELLEKFKLPNTPLFNYRDKSVLDLFLSRLTNQNQVNFLREHYRSTPSLIEFNNQEFYDSQLEIIKSTPEYTNENQIEIEILEGTRDKKGINSIEAERVVSKIKELIKTYKTYDDVPTIGIIAPFSSQVKYINSLISDQIPYEAIKQFKIVCGTPYTFQGSEREIILISFTVCNNTHHSAYTHLNKAEVLNVGTTRAKSFQYIYTSVDKKDLNKDSLFFKYLNFIENYQYETKNSLAEKDDFQDEIVEVLKKLNIEYVNLSYPLAGSILDIFFIHKQQKYFIDLIGYPGAHYNAFSIERYKTFSRIGIKTFPLHYSYWKKNKQNVQYKIDKFITKKV